MIECQNCHYSDLIDGTLFCWYNEEDVLFNECCDNFVNQERLEEIFEDIKDNFIKNND